MRKTFNMPEIDAALMDGEELCVMFGTEEKIVDDGISGSKNEKYYHRVLPKDEFRKDNLSDF